MNVSCYLKASVSIVFAVAVLIANTPATATPPPSEIDELFEARMLAESGWTYPAIEEMQKARREAAARAKLEEAVKAGGENERPVDGSGDKVGERRRGEAK